METWVVIDCWKNPNKPKMFVDEKIYEYGNELLINYVSNRCNLGQWYAS